MITRITAVLVLGSLLCGCATLTAGAIGGLVAAGLITGAGKYAGETVARGAWTRHVAWKKCRHLRNDRPRLEMCVRRHLA